MGKGWTKSKVVRIRCKVEGKVNEESVVERSQQVKTQGEREEKTSHRESRGVGERGSEAEQQRWRYQRRTTEYKEMSEIDEVEMGNERGENGSLEAVGAAVGCLQGDVSLDTGRVRVIKGHPSMAEGTGVRDK
ncbi:hypothetical protein EDB87DRAFT_1578371 [Lactarius vividus]|nr:hypothetical protein EDB87DRAFT_1578371 [Lactarius vividus]